MGSLAQKANPGIAVATDDPDFLRNVARIINNLLIGKVNVTGTVRLGHGAVSTTVSDARCSADSIVMLMATSADAAVALDQWRVSTITDGSFVITHVSTSTSTCTAKYAVLG